MTPTPATALARLTAILQQENAALTSLDFDGATRLLDAKRAAVAAFEAAGDADPDPEALGRLRAAAFANATLIERAMKVQRRVIETVVGAAPKPAVRQYRADAGMARPRRATPIALLARA